MSKFTAMCWALVISVGICLLITATTPIPFVWLLVPVIIILSLGYLDHYLKEKISLKFPLVFSLGLIFSAVIGWHLLMLSMPHTADALKSWRLYSDLLSFQKKVPGVKSLGNLADYQTRLDSALDKTTKQMLDSALSTGDLSKIDSVIALINKNTKIFEKVSDAISNAVVKEEKPSVRKEDSTNVKPPPASNTPVNYVPPPVIKKSKPVVTKLGNRYYRVDFDANDTVRVAEFKVKKGDHYWIKDPTTTIYIKDAKQVYNIPYSMGVTADGKHPVTFYTKEKGSVILSDE